MKVEGVRTKKKERKGKERERKRELYLQALTSLPVARCTGDINTVVVSTKNVLPNTHAMAYSCTSLFWIRCLELTLSDTFLFFFFVFFSFFLSWLNQSQKCLCLTSTTAFGTQRCTSFGVRRSPCIFSGTYTVSTVCRGCI